MKKVKVITQNVELEEFLARTDIEIINVDVRSCAQSWFAQEYFTAVIYYDDEPKSEYTPDYWTRLEHTYAGMAMQGLLSSGKLNIIMDNSDVLPEGIAIVSRDFARALVEKLKEKEEK